MTKMRINVNDLQRVAGEAMNAEAEAKALREEIVRVLGQRVVVEAPIGRVAADACQVIDSDELSGLRSPSALFNKKLMLRYTMHGNPHVRKLAARVVPSSYLTKMLDDSSSLVRAEAAKRADVKLVSEALNRHPDDDGMYDTYASRLLCEDGIKQPEVTDDEPFDMYGDEPLGDAVKQQPGAELSDTWYKNRAFEFMQDYGTNIEYAWEETLVKVYCDALHTTSGIDVDRARLLKAIKDLIEEKEDRALERDKLKEGKLSRGSLGNKMVKCRGCGKLTHSNIDNTGLELCRKCYEQVNLENEHNDGYHKDLPDPECELCAFEEESRAVTPTIPHGMKEARGLKRYPKGFGLMKREDTPKLVTDADVMKALKMWPKWQAESTRHGKSTATALHDFCDSFFSAAKAIPDFATSHMPTDEDLRHMSDELYAKLDDLLDEDGNVIEHFQPMKEARRLKNPPKVLRPRRQGGSGALPVGSSPADYFGTPAPHKGYAFGDIINIPVDKPMKMTSLHMVDDVMRFFAKLEALGYKDNSKTPDFVDSASDDTITIKSKKMAEDPRVHEIFLDAGIKEETNEAQGLDETDDYYFDVSGDVPQCPKCGGMTSGSPGCLKCAECDYDQEKMMPEKLKETRYKIVYSNGSVDVADNDKEMIEMVKQSGFPNASVTPLDNGGDVDPLRFGMDQLVDIFGQDVYDRALEWLNEHPESDQSLCGVCEELAEIDASDEAERSWMPDRGFEESVDPVSSLTPHLGTQEFIRLAEQVFSIQKSIVPPGIRKHRLGEGNAKPSEVPVVGRLPEGRSTFTSEDERALDEFCVRWSKRQASAGEPFALRWDPHPDQAGKLGFRLELV